MITFSSTEIPDDLAPDSQLTAELVASIELQHHHGVPWDELTPMLILIYGGGDTTKVDLVSLDGDPTRQLADLSSKARNGLPPPNVDGRTSLIAACLLVEANVRVADGARREARYAYGHLANGSGFQVQRLQGSETAEFRWYPAEDTESPRARGPMINHLRALTKAWGAPEVGVSQ